MNISQAKHVIAIVVAALVAATAAGASPRVRPDMEHQPAVIAASGWARVIVRLAGPTGNADVRALAGKVGARNVRRLWLIDGFAAEMTASQASRLAGLPGVVSVEPDGRVHAVNDSAQFSFGVTEARLDLPALDGNADGSASYSAADLVAAVVDTGIDAGHLDLDEGKVLAFVDCTASCAATGPYDDNGHGTHVAATIAGDGDARADRKYHGVAPGAGLVGVKVIDATGNGFDSDVVAGLQWVVAHSAQYGIEAVNVSLGGDVCSSGLDAISAAVNAAHAAGLVVVVAAGNDGPGACTIGSPGAAAGALTVGAMADMGVNAPSDPLGPFGPGFYAAWFSSRGPTGDGRVKPDVSAPGIDVTSAEAGTETGYVTHDGTSMATPFVAGVTLLMLDANPTLTAAQVKERIMASASDWGAEGADNEYGAGRLDAYAALRAAGAPLTSPPAMPPILRAAGSLSSHQTVSYPLNLTSTSFPVGATLVNTSISDFESSNPDFNVYLKDPAGAVVAKSEYTTRQDDFGYEPTSSGLYTVEVKSKAGSGNYLLDVSAPTSLPVVSISDAVITEGGVETSPFVSVNVSLSAASGFPVKLRWRTVGGSAVSGSDFNGLATDIGVVTFAPGDTSEVIPVQVFGDALDEKDETFAVALSRPINAAIGNATGTVTILDDDPPPALSVSNARRIERDAGTRYMRFVVRLTAASGRTVKVRYATRNGTATAPRDYRGTAGTLTFPPGRTARPVYVSIKGDVRNEANERFFLRLSSPLNATFLDRRGRGVIVDDD